MAREIADIGQTVFGSRQQKFFFFAVLTGPPGHSVSIERLFLFILFLSTQKIDKELKAHGLTRAPAPGREVRHSVHNAHTYITEAGDDSAHVRCSITVKINTQLHKKRNVKPLDCFQ